MEPIGDIQVEKVQEPAAASQPPVAQEPPIAEVNPLKDLSPQMDEQAIRAAIAKAEAEGIDPLSLTVEALKEPVKTEDKPTVEIDAKFKKPNGEVDVEKLETSTRQLAEALQKKEQKIQETAEKAQKTPEELFLAYKEMQKKMSQLPNPEKLAAAVTPPPTPAPTQSQSLDQLKAKILQDMQTDPVGAITELIDIISEKKLEPVKSHFEQTLEERRDNAIRENIKALAAKDARVLQHFDAINAELAADPDYWKLKNPHKAAWLEVKERLRLGEPQAPAQPSKIPSPVLGGGTPPSTPSSMGTPTPSFNTIAKLDPRDKKQEAMGDELMRQYFARQR